MEFDELQPLRRSGANEGEETSRAESEYPPGAGISGNPITQLVADLIETTGLLPLDRLSMARSRAGIGSLAQAIMDNRLSSSAELLVPGPRVDPQAPAAADNEAKTLADATTFPTSTSRPASRCSPPSPSPRTS